MSAQTALLYQWKKALVFRIGEDEAGGQPLGFGQLPDMLQFPLQFPIEPEGGQLADETTQVFAGYLGMVLSIAMLKAYGATYAANIAAGIDASLDPCGGFILDAADALHALRRRYVYAKEFAVSYLWAVGTVTEMALTAPERLPELRRRLDALDNADLAKMGLGAVQGIMPADIFEGLLEVD